MIIITRFCTVRNQRQNWEHLMLRLATALLRVFAIMATIIRQLLLRDRKELAPKLVTFTVSSISVDDYNDEQQCCDNKISHFYSAID